jgi:hypothetical protein
MEGTNDANIQRATSEALRSKRETEKLVYEIESSKADATVKSSTIQQNIDAHNLALAEGQLRIDLGRQGIKLSEEQIKKINADIKQRYMEMNVNERNSERVADAIVQSAVIGGVGGFLKGQNELLKGLFTKGKIAPTGTPSGPMPTWK